jgi:hypothetical protein
MQVHGRAYKHGDARGELFELFVMNATETSHKVIQLFIVSLLKRHSGK